MSAPLALEPSEKPIDHFAGVPHRLDADTVPPCCMRGPKKEEDAATVPPCCMRAPKKEEASDVDDDASTAASESSHARAERS
mmetsp:Transcript_42367/g.79394  ORF Transcript_42367/g.79394 Transcript_42367/m.79394 type:complete len:82 (-) Transcript_42367:196-441(-)